MKTMILAPPRVLPSAQLRATKPCASARRIFSSLLVAGSVSLAAVAATVDIALDRGKQSERMTGQVGGPG